MMLLVGSVLLAPGGSTAAAASEAEQKAVLITGASTGIGRVTAEHLAGEGYFVYAGARKPEDLAALNAIDNIQAVRLDVTVQEEIDAAVEHIAAEGRGLWGVVNNAGVNTLDPLIEGEIEDVEFIFDVNVYGVYRVTKAFAPMVIESQGRIVNISSIAGTLSGGLTGYGPYVMSKHAVEAYTDQLSWELMKFNVHVAAVEPGNFESAIGKTRCKRMLRIQAEKSYQYFEEEMMAYLDGCREYLAEDDAEPGNDPQLVADAIEHALFAEQPKEHYLVAPVQFEAQITIGKAIEEMLHLNYDQPFSFSREEFIEMMDNESARIRGEKPPGPPGTE